MQSNLSFSFGVSELTDRLKQVFDETLTGYWQIQFSKGDRSRTPQPRFLGVVQGRVICSGTEKLVWKTFLATLNQSIPQLRQPPVQQAFGQLQQELSSKEAIPLSKIVVEMVNMKLVTHDDVTQALRQKILIDLDNFLFDYAGQAQFVPEPELVVNTPIRGFELSGLIVEAINRQSQWKQLQKYIPSLDSSLNLKQEAIETSNLTTPQKQQLQNLVKPGKNLAAIARTMGKDPLEVVKFFSQLIEKGLIEVQKPADDPADTQSMPEIFIVDDSPLLVQQFRQLVEGWGYQVKYSNNALTAVQTMMESQPVAIFLDINMPGASGFDLIKQIRRQPQLASLPLVLLTAEKSVSNQWRAQWASCKFLAKPRTPAEVPTFRSDLRQMLFEIAPTTKNSLV
jgi:CheY-like chemotaxis protein